MSINIHIRSERQIFYVSPETGELVAETQKEYWSSEWLTPTNVSYQIVESEDPLQAYIDWVRGVSQDVEEEVYAEDDYLCLREPIGTRTVNLGDFHIEELLGWVGVQRKRGFSILVEVM